MGLDFPSKIINSTEFSPVLCKVFSYYAEVYDLEAYEAIRSGFGQSIWNLICAEREYQEAQKRFDEPNFIKRMFG